MNKKDTIETEVAISPSVPLICSADAVLEDAERELVEQMSRVFDEIADNLKPADIEIARITSDDFWQMFESF